MGRGSSPTESEGVQVGTESTGSNLAISYKKMHYFFDPEIALQEIYLSYMLTHVQNTCV